MERCRGLRDHLAQLGNHCGHTIADFDTASGAFSICVKCGGHGAHKSAKLSALCGLPTADGVRAIRRVYSRGQHPDTGQPLSRSRKGDAAVPKVRPLRTMRDRAFIKEQKAR